jgi:hypothetical protein
MRSAGPVRKQTFCAWDAFARKIELVVGEAPCWDGVGGRDERETPSEDARFNGDHHPEYLAATAVCIDSPAADGKGSGFFVRRLVSTSESGDEECRVFVVTNKHVIAAEAGKRHAVARINLLVNHAFGVNGAVAEDTSLDVRATTIDVGLYCGCGAALWREHPSDDVDVFTFEVTSALKARADVVWVSQFIEEDTQIANATLRAKHHITVGEDVLALLPRIHAARA